MQAIGFCVNHESSYMQICLKSSKYEHKKEQFLSLQQNQVEGGVTVSIPHWTKVETHESLVTQQSSMEVNK